MIGQALGGISLVPPPQNTPATSSPPGGLPNPRLAATLRQVAEPKERRHLLKRSPEREQLGKPARGLSSPGLCLDGLRYAQTPNPWKPGPKRSGGRRGRRAGVSRDVGGAETPKEGACPPGMKCDKWVLDSRYLCYCHQIGKYLLWDPSD